MKKYIFGAVLIISSVSYAPPKNKRTSSNTASSQQNEIDSAGICSAQCLLDVAKGCPSAQGMIASILFKEMMRRDPRQALETLEFIERERLGKKSDENSKQ